MTLRDRSRRRALIKLVAEHMSRTEIGSIIRAETDLERTDRRALGNAARARAGAAWVAYHRGLHKRSDW